MYTRNDLQVELLSEVMQRFYPVQSNERSKIIERHYEQ